MIAQPPRVIDWGDLVVRAQDLGWARGTWITLDLVREHLGIAPPDSVLTALRPDDAPNENVRAKAMEILFLDQHTAVTPENLLRLTDAPWNRKVSLLWHRAFPSRDEVATQFNVPLGQRNFWIYYVRRLGRLLIHLPRLWAMVRDDMWQQGEMARTRVVRNWLGN